MIVVITTCERPGSSYLEPLMRSIDTSRWNGRRLVVADGPLSTRSDWPVLAGPSRLGQMRTYWRALATGVDEARRHGSDRITIFEDDVEICHNALQYMERARMPDALDFVTWFDGHVVPPGSRHGIYPVPAQYFFCLQGVTWRVSVAERLLAAPQAQAWPEPHRGDILIARILAGRKYGVHVPNLVQHRGDVSLCNPGQGLAGVRTAANYPGPQLDALQLVTK
jgi:hypothetical protein